MAKVAQAIPRFSGSNAIAISSWQEEYPATSVIVDIDTGNIVPGSPSVSDANSLTPTIYVLPRTVHGTGGLWRHFSFAVDNVEGKTPVFQVDNASRDGNYSSAHWRPVYTTDHVTFTQASSLSVGGSPNVVQFSFSSPLPSGTVYIYSSPIGRQQDAISFASALLTNYPAIASPTASSDASGIFNTIGSRLDDLGKEVGNQSMYAIKLEFGGSTTDGLRKRKIVLCNGAHAAGEAQSWYVFKAAVEWILDSVSAEAQNFRDNFDVWLYFLLNPCGVFGGNARNSFASGQYNTDPNRSFTDDATGVIPEINAFINAVKADTSNNVDVWLDFHGDVYRLQDFIFIPPSSEVSAGTRSQMYQALVDDGTAIFGASPYISGIIGDENTTSMGFAIANLDAKLAIFPEFSARYKTTSSWYADMGQKWVRTIEAMDADSAFIIGLQPALFTHTNIFFAHTLTQDSQTLEPSLFVNNNTFYSATLNLGPVTLEPGLLANTNQFYGHTVSQDGATQTLQPNLFVNSNTFFAAAIAPGAITIEPGLFSNVNTFYAHTLNVGLQTLQPDLLVNTNQFYNAEVQVGPVTIIPDLFVNGNTFYAHTVSQDGQLQTLSPDLFVNESQFFAATVLTGSITIQPQLLINNNNFYAAEINAVYRLQPNLFSNSNQFYSPTVSVGSITLSPELFTNTNTFYTHSVGGQNRVRWSSSITINQSSQGITIQ